MGLVNDGEQPVVVDDQMPDTPNPAEKQPDQKSPASETVPEENAAETTAETEGGPEAEIVSLKEQLAVKTAEAEDCLGRLQRMQADFDNFRKRWRREQEEIGRYAAERVIVALLPVLDDFDRALAAGKQTGEAPGLLEGVAMIVHQLQEVLGKEGLAPIEAVGQPFDPYYHDAVMQVETTDYETNTVIEELRKGYRLGDKIIRPSLVKVAQYISGSGN